MSETANTSVFNSVFDLYKFYRSELDFEYSRINDRMNWLLVSHAFLFTVLAALLSCSEVKATQNFFLFIVVSLLGMVSAGCVAIGVTGAKVRVSDIKTRGKEIYNSLSASSEKKEGISIDMIPCALPMAHKFGGIPSAVLPSLLTGVWGFVSLRELYSINYGNEFLVWSGYACIVCFLMICLWCFCYGANDVVLKLVCQEKCVENSDVIISHKVVLYGTIALGMIACYVAMLFYFGGETIFYTKIAMTISFSFVLLSILFQLIMVWHSS